MKPEKPRRRRPVYDEALGRAIKVLRTEQRLERRDLAQQAGVSYSYLAEIENGNKPPSSQVLFALCEVLGVRPSQLHAAADSLRERTEGEPRISPRQAQVAASIQRAWDRPAEPQLRAMSRAPDVARPSEKEDLLRELHYWQTRMDEADLEVLVQMARRLGGRSPENR